MKKILLMLVAVMGTTSLAMAQNEPEGKILANNSFDAVDINSKGYLTYADIEFFRQQVFVSMDANENNAIELEEFLSWDFGFELAATEVNRLSAYKTALKVVFNFWDRNNDGRISLTEHRKAIVADFERADIDNNVVLERAEYVQGFSILAAIRAAIKTE